MFHECHSRDITRRVLQPTYGDCFRDLKAGLTKAVKNAALEGITWHTFRYTFASRLTLDGTDLVTVKELLGHADISTTMRYAHTNDETKKLAVSNSEAPNQVVTALQRNEIR